MLLNNSCINLSIIPLMYKEYFGLKENPFSIAPDPRFLYMSKGHSEALAHLVYGVNSDGGFILLTGEVGTGKTTVCRCLLDNLPENSEVAFLLNPRVTVVELLAGICDEFRIGYPPGNKSNKVFISLINDYLLAVHEKGKRAILIIEEAQNLRVDVLEQIRLLTNLETNERKLLQIVLLGQPELRRLLAQPSLRQLNQRITVRYHLSPLMKEEIPAYVNHRLTVAGFARGRLFSKKQLSELYRLTGGIPRLINMICDRALIGVFVQNKNKVDSKTLLTAAHEVSGRKNRILLKRSMFAIVGVIVILAVIALLGLSPYPFRKSVPAPQTSTKQVPVVASVTVHSNGTLDKPVNMTEADTLRTAYESLFQQWQVSARIDRYRPICEQAKEKGLQCLTANESLIELRQLNRPAVLTLTDGSRNRYFATLVSLGLDTAVLSIGGRLVEVNVREIFSRWTGEYTVLWKLPYQYTTALLQGSKDPLVEWLDQRLAVIHGRPVAAHGKQTFDEELTREVKQFQISAGLVPDGIAGARTLIRLSDFTDTGLKGPTLSAKKETQADVVHP